MPTAWQQPSRTGRCQNLFTLVFTAIFLTRTVTAQTNPVVERGFQWSVSDQKTLYIQGGSSASFYALDLTRSFADTSPPWTTLAPGVNTGGQYMVLSADKSKLYLWDTYNSVISTYTIATNQWQNGTEPAGMGYKSRLAAALDPDTNIMYIPNGFYGTGGMVAYNANTGVSTSITTPTIPKDLSSYGLMWSTHRKSMLLYAGNNGSIVTFSELYEFNPATGSWTTLTASGVGPGALSGHCMVPAYGGTVMVVFGGWGATSSETGQISFLDLKTLTWTSGPPAVSVRSDMACATSGDSFIAWGGQKGGSVTPNLPLIYNMRAKEWTRQFDPTMATPTASSTPSRTITAGTTGGPSSRPTGNGSGNGSGSGNGNGNTTPPGNEPSSEGSSVAAIAGGVAGGAGVIFICLFFFVRQRKSRKQNNSSIGENLSRPEVAHVGHPFVEGKIEPEPFHQQGPPPPPPPSSFLPFNTPTTVASPYNPMAITPSEAPIAYSPQQQFSGAYPLYSAPPPPVYPASTRPVSSQEATGITRSPSPQVAFTPVSPSGSDTLYQASPQEYTISRNNPQDRTTPSHEVMADSYVGPEPNFRDAAWQQQDGSAAFYAPPPPPSSSSPQTLPPGAPQSLPPRVPHAMPPGAPQQRTSPSLPSSPSSMSSVPSAGVAAENKADLARRQKDLMQQQHLLDMERLRLEHELQLRRLDDESNME